MLDRKKRSTEYVLYIREKATLDNHLAEIETELQRIMHEVSKEGCDHESSRFRPSLPPP